MAGNCNRRLIFVHFRRNKSDPDRRFNSDLTCSLYRLDSYKRDNILLKVYKGESRGGFTDLLRTPYVIGDLHA